MFSCVFYVFPVLSRSLSQLADVDLAEEGVLRLLFASVYPIFVRVASENEIVFATRYTFSLIAICFCK